jgi:hypothetical protein
MHWWSRGCWKSPSSPFTSTGIGEGLHTHESQPQEGSFASLSGSHPPNREVPQEVSHVLFIQEVILEASVSIEESTYPKYQRLISFRCPIA